MSFQNNIKWEYKTSVRTFDTREIKRKSYGESAHNTTLERRSNKRTKKKSQPRTKYFIKFKNTKKEGLCKAYKQSFLYKYNCLDLCFII